ncbi:hypothetical protein DFH11DRAFT_1881341 [Phellopilus nigrolimitatus]|nr:hypothetical protein DFH11DRAFT_1881341 [Phellopilus nigrolimitatus]
MPYNGGGSLPHGIATRHTIPREPSGDSKFEPRASKSSKSFLLLHHHPLVIVIVAAAAAITSPSSFTPLPSSFVPAAALVLAATLRCPRRHPPSSSPPPSLMFAGRPHILNREEEEEESWLRSSNARRSGLPHINNSNCRCSARPSLASPPPTFSHTALPTSTAFAVAGSPGSSASPKPLHSSSTSSPFLNHAAQLTAAQAPFLSSALADADARCRELTVAQGRATRAEHLLASVQGLPSRASPDPNVDGEKVNGERERENDMKAEPKALESAAKVVLDAEARAERAERSHADLAESLQSLCAQFTKVERYEHAGSLVPPTRAPLLRPSSTASHAPIPVTRPPHLSRARIFSTNDDETLTLPSLPLPHAIGAPSSGSSMLTGPSTHPAPPASSTSLRAILPRSVSTSRLRRTLYSIWLPDTDTDKDWVTCGKAPNRARLSTRFRFPTAIRHEALDVRCGRHSSLFHAAHAHD